MRMTQAFAMGQNLKWVLNMAQKKNVNKKSGSEKKQTHYFPFPMNRNILEDLSIWVLEHYPETKEKLKENAGNKQKIQLLQSLLEKGYLSKENFNKEIKQYTTQKNVLPIKVVFRYLFEHLEKLDESFPKISSRLE